MSLSNLQSPISNRRSGRAALRLLLALAVLRSAFGVLPAATITHTFLNPDGSAFTNTVLFRPSRNRAVYVAPSLTAYVDTRVTPDEDGAIIATLRAGNYNVFLGATLQFAIGVPDSTNSFELAGLISDVVLTTAELPTVSTVGDATASAGGKVKTDVTEANPVVYLKSSVDTLLAAKLATTNGTSAGLTLGGTSKYGGSDKSYVGVVGDWGVGLTYSISGTPELRVSARSVQTLSDLTNSVDPLSVNLFAVVRVMGYTSANDGGGGDFVRVSASGQTVEYVDTFPSSSASWAWRRLRDGPISVKQAGAVGDGSTDDLAAFTRAIAAGISQGREVFVPAATYNVSSSVPFVKTPWTSGAVLTMRGEMTADSAGSVIRCTDNTVPVVIGNGSFLTLENLSLRHSTLPTSSQTNGVGLLITNAHSGALKNLYLWRNATLMRTDADGTFYSMKQDGVKGYEYTVGGLLLYGSGTPNDWYGTDIRNAPSTATATGTLSVAAATNCTVSGLSSAFIAQMVPGQIIQLSGITPSGFSTRHTLLTTNASEITFSLGSDPGGAPSGTATITLFTGRSTLPAIYTAQDAAHVFHGLRVEWDETDRMVDLVGASDIAGEIHIEGFTGAGTTDDIVRSSRGLSITKVSFINSTIPAGKTYHLFNAAGTAPLDVGTWQTRDNFIGAGATLSWSKSSTYPVVFDSPDPLTTLRWNRTSDFSAEPGFIKRFRRGGLALEDWAFDVRGTSDRLTAATGNSLNTYVASTWPTTLTPATFVLQNAGGNLSVGLLGTTVFTLNSGLNLANTAKTSSFTDSNGRAAHVVDTTGGAVTATLTGVSSRSGTLQLFINSGTAALTLDPASSETINGATTLTIPAGASQWVYCDGAAWFTVGVSAVGQLTGLGTGVATALGVNVGSAGAFVVNGGALGTPSSGTLTSATGLPISTGVSGLGSGVATYLATPTVANYVTAADVPVELVVALSDETTVITTGTAKVTMRAPWAFTLTAVRASLNTVSSSGVPTVDINEGTGGGTTVLSTKLTIDASELTSTTAAAAAVISDSAIADDAELTFDIDVAGTGAKGLKVILYGYR